MATIEINGFRVDVDPLHPEPETQEVADPAADVGGVALQVAGKFLLEKVASIEQTETAPSGEVLEIVGVFHGHRSHSAGR